MLNITIVVAQHQYDHGFFLEKDTYAYRIQIKQPPFTAANVILGAIKTKVRTLRLAFKNSPFNLAAILVDGYPEANYINPETADYTVELEPIV